MRGIYIGFLLIIIAFAAYSQREAQVPFPVDSITQRYTYTEVVPADNYSTVQLYHLYKQWQFNKYVDTTFILDNKVDRLVDQHLMSVVASNNALLITTTRVMNIEYTMSLDFKDGKYRYILNNISVVKKENDATMHLSLENFVASAKDANLITQKGTLNYIEIMCVKIHEELQKTIADMKLAMKQSLEDKKDNW